MEVNQVTFLKLIFFTFCVILITIFVRKLVLFDVTSDSSNMCQALLARPEVTQSVIADKCPSGFYPNYGKFSDVKKDSICCVKYTRDSNE